MTLTNPQTAHYHPIEDYGIIGDLRTNALIGPNGSIDFMCFPRFDSPSIFAATVDHKQGGRFKLEPLLEEPSQKRLYLPGTNIHLSRFLAQGGVAEVSDFMVVDWNEDCEQALCRRAKAVHGDVSFRMTFDPRFDYARSKHKVEKISENEIIFVSQGSDGLALRLLTPFPVQIEDGAAVCTFTLKQGETAPFIMDRATSGVASPISAPDYISEAFKRTSNYWRSWIARSQYRGRWRETVDRSALALKLLTSRELGSIIAAPCFGFPNEVGGERNWDYRFTWIRDASFTIYAFLRLGFVEEAERFIRWLEARCHEIDDGESLQIMYSLDGSLTPDEFHLEHLEGYMKSKPIRIGSTNHGQVQLDIYGELMDSVYLYDKYGDHISHDLWVNMTKLVEYVCSNWMKPDSGIWEVRGGNKEFLYSRFMCWVAVDRALRLARRRSLPVPADRWRKVRDEIYQSVFRDFWNEEKQSFVQFKGGTSLDASTLMMPLVKFISPTDPRWISTLRAIENELVEDSLVYRYNVGEAFSDMLAGGEGTFSICSFWYIECVSRSGDLEKARYLFEKILGYSNRLGLFSEQLGSRGEFLGNVPQAFTHLALISTAFDLDRRLNASGKD